MEKVRKAFPVICISTVFIIVFNILAFVLASDFHKNFWCGYIFITLSWMCLITVEILSANKNDNGCSVFLNAPSILMTVLHLLIQTIVGVIVMAFSNLNMKALLCFEIVLFSIYLVIIGGLELYKAKATDNRRML